ncbi:PEBP-like protein [Colletotrichum zoysiae]|uniref:PEBP-like protein n=1 Tax=Colletotrichum zoysiae TaxID=1216348 RepID=A0AAD9HTN7_9PEZI|nr:PEBP-like protein [Colletotrichum zoysiae]
MKSVVSFLAFFSALGCVLGDAPPPPRSMSTREFRRAFLDAGIVPDVMGSFNPTVSFYTGYKTGDGNKTLMMPGAKLQPMETKFPFEFSVENIMNAQNVTRNTRYILCMIGPDSPTRDGPTERNMRHYLAGNLTVEQTKSEILSSALVMRNSSPAFNDYMAPDPKSGSGVHRYVYLLYVQPEKLNKMGFDAMGVDMKERKKFSVSQFRKQAGLSRPIGGTVFTVDMGKNNDGGNGGNNGGGNGHGGSTASIATAGSIFMFITLLTTMFVWM